MAAWEGEGPSNASGRERGTDEARVVTGYCTRDVGMGVFADDDDDDDGGGDDDDDDEFIMTGRWIFGSIFSVALNLSPSNPQLPCPVLHPDS